MDASRWPSRPPRWVSWRPPSATPSSVRCSGRAPVEGEDRALQLDPALRVLALEPAGEDEPLALAQTSEGVEAVGGLEPEALRQVLLCVQRHQRRSRVLEALEAD